MINFSPCSKYIVSCSKDSLAKLWSTQTGENVQTLIGHNDSINSVEFSPDGKSIMTSSDDKSIKIWSVNIETSENIELF